MADSISSTPDKAAIPADNFLAKPSAPDAGEVAMRQILDAIPHIAWATDASGAVTYMNARWREFTGVDGRDIEAVRDAIHPDDLPSTTESMTRSRATGIFNNYDLRLRSRAGDYRWHRVRSTAIRDAEGTPVYWIGTSTDVHDEVIAADALRESEDHFRFLVDSNPQVPWLANAEGVLVDVSEGWLKMTGLTRYEALKGGWLDVPHPGDLPEMLKAWEHAQEFGEIMQIEHRARMADGSYRWMRTRSVPRRDSAGQVIKWYGTTEDVHERRIAEEAYREGLDREKVLNEDLERRVAERTAELVQANRKLEEAYREAESFSYTASHDLRSPLRAVISTARILIEDHGGHLPKDALQLLHEQSAAAHKLAHIIDDLLTYSRIGKHEVRRERLDLEPLAHQVFAELVPEIPEFRLEVEAGIEAAGDPMLLGLVLQNLIENAIIYSPKGGTMRVGRDMSDEKRPYFVEDQGIGFEMEFADRIFEPFQRLHRDGEFSGTGIGLANVKRIIERHDGSIWVRSEPGRGSTFYFTLGA